MRYGEIFDPFRSLHGVATCVKSASHAASILTDQLALLGIATSDRRWLTPRLALHKTRILNGYQQCSGRRKVTSSL